MRLQRQRQTDAHIPFLFQEFQDHRSPVSASLPSLDGFLTDIQRSVLLTRKVVYVGDPQRLNRRLSDPPQDVSQEDVNPHGQVGLSFAPCTKGQQEMVLVYKPLGIELIELRVVV